LTETKVPVVQVEPKPAQTEQRAKPTAFTGSLVKRGPNKDAASLPTPRTSTKPQHEETNQTAQNTGPKPGSNASHAKQPSKASSTRPISPPKTARTNLTTAPGGAPKKESLMPRKVPKDPVQFQRRFVFVRKLKECMAKLNSLMIENPDVKNLSMDDDELTRLAKDEEEKIAVDSFQVYENVIKNRITKLTKMSADVWIAERKAATAKNQEDTGKKEPPPIDTGLSWDEESLVVQRLIASKTDLRGYGYVIEPFSEAELESARKGVTSSDHWEQCDRCSTRFQVFPDRREEDGALTSVGKCHYHWGKRAYAKKTKTEIGPQHRFTCCNDLVGSEGCVTHDTHVFKVSDNKRLWNIMPFIETPENPNAEPGFAVCFDCEMGYTTLGLELLRLTAVSWPSHKPLIDILVRPLGTILDLNTRFSGIQPEQYFNAAPYDGTDPTTDPKKLHIVESPYKAREILLSYITTTTPLIGHALENDLNCVRLIHPTIVDTAILFPHNRGLPYRMGLRHLTKQYLNQDIQQGGAAGHDSHEDARATGELVRFKVGKEWKLLKSKGWSIRDGEIFPPVPSGPPPTSTSTGTNPSSDSADGDKHGVKRKRDGDDDDEDMFRD
jgi:hypothetical protein